MAQQIESGSQRQRPGRTLAIPPWAAVTVWLAAMLVMSAIRASAQAVPSDPTPQALKSLSLQQLFDVEVTMVSKHPERLAESASAIQVITAEDIRRSGATHLADALRLASNLEVQQINSYAWSVSARGFDAAFSNKLLVLIDGRMVYTPLDAGVLWDAQGVLIEDIDRIEVVSGPGGALWGANAVNGVINIITKSPRQTRGVYTSATGGTFQRDAGAFRLGGSAGEHRSFRVYGQRSDLKSTQLANGDDGTNGWNMSQGGFRVDAYGSARNTVTVQGDGYGAIEYNSASGRSTLNGQNVLTRWTHTSSETSDLSVQVYFDRTWRRDIPSTITDELMTYDLDFQHRIPAGRRHHLLWGAGYRVMQDHTETSTPLVGFVPARKDMPLASGFVQDEIALVPGRLRWVVGARIENNVYSGTELLPSTRLAWSPTDRQTVWSAVARAVRAPSRIDADYHIPKLPPYFVGGGPGFDAEKVVSYEAGYRLQPAGKASISLATFYSRYTDVYSVEPASSAAVFPYTIQNGTEGQSWGIEASGAYQPAAVWRLRGGYTYTRKLLWSQPGHNVIDAVIASLGNDPRHAAVLQSMWNVSTHAQWDVTARYVDALPNPQVHSYLAVDSRLALHHGPWELELVGQNLTDKRHPEFITAQQVPRGGYARVSSRW